MSPAQRPRPLHRVLLVVAALCVAAAGAPPAAAQDDRPGGTSRDLGAVGLVSQTTWVAADGTVDLRLDVGAAHPADRLTVTFHDRLRSRAQLATTVAGGGLPSRLRTMADAPVAELDPDGDGRVELMLGLRSGAGEPERQRVSGFGGVHPVSVELTNDEGSVGGFVTYVVRLPDEVEHPLGLAIIQRLPTEPAIRSDGSTVLADSTRALLTNAEAIFARSSDVPVTYEVAPETLSALAASEEPLDDQLLDGLRALLDDGHVAASPFVEVDVDALVRGGMAGELGGQLDLGTAILDADLDLSPDLTTWIDDGRLGATGLDELAQRGVRHLVTSRAALDGDLPDLLVQPLDVVGDDARVAALATDPLLQAHAGSTGSSLLDAQHLLADLAAIWFERPAYPRATVLVLPDDELDPGFLDPVLAGIDASPLVAVRSVPDAIDRADPAATGGIDDQVEDPADRLTAQLSGPDRAADITRHRDDVRRARAQLDSFARIFADDPLLRASFDFRLATSFSAALDADERGAYVRSVRDEVDTHIGQISMPDRGAITLPSRDGVIPLTLVNDSGVPATVVIELASEKLEFLDGDRVEVTLTEAHTSLTIRVRARASGVFRLDTRVMSPDHRIELAASSYTVRSTAVSGLGILLSGVAIVVLAAWWIRTARRARSAGRSNASSGDR